jgi:hypothetical protein
MMIHGEIEEEPVACQFSSIRVQKGGATAWPSAGGGRRPGWAGVGLSALGPKADGASFDGR